MNINSAFPSKYLKASDLNGGSVSVTIERVELEEVGQGAQKEQKPVVYFMNKSKGMVLNKTNAQMIANIAGSPETEDWTGTQIRLVSAEVEFQGQVTEALRVRKPAAGSARQAPPPEPANAPDEDEIPF